MSVLSKLTGTSQISNCICKTIRGLNEATISTTTVTKIALR